VGLRIRTETFGRDIKAASAYKPLRRSLVGKTGGKDGVLFVVTPLASCHEASANPLPYEENLMFITRFKAIATLSLALAGIVALSACSKKVDDTVIVPAPAPMAAPSSDPYSPSPSDASSPPMGPSGMGSSSMGTSTLGSGMPAPTMPASGTR